VKGNEVGICRDLSKKFVEICKPLKYT